MFKKTYLAAVVGLLLPVTAFGQTLLGQVVSHSGKAISNARIELEEQKITLKADKEGHFKVEDLEPGEYEIHIVAPGFAHLHTHVTVTDAANPLTFTLERSAIEVVDVVATPMHMSVMESASPVNVLGGESLRRQQAATLGDSLEKLPGVQTNFHGNVASTPIIRGLSGPRIMIAQNGLEVGDVSRVGPDHSVAAEASTARQIEVLRGPATLFYGSGAIGGVVNVVDSRVPTDSTTRGEWLLETASVNDQKLASFNATTGTDAFAVYADGYWRDSNDYETPVPPDIHEAGSGNFTVENSGEESNGLTLGVSHLMDNGYIGIAVEKFNREYGIPGHSHEGHDHEGEASEEEQIYADLDQTKVQVLGEFEVDGEWINRINLRAGHTEYEHAEIEDSVVGTLFENTTQELRLDVMHAPIAEWKGGISLHYKNSDVSAQGSEAFTPPSETETFALAIMEERHLGEVLLQLGARVERVTLNASDVLLPHLEAHPHDEEGEDGHGGDHEEEVTRVFAVDQQFTPISLSAGIVWDFTPGYNIGLSVSRSQRAPAASELLSFGPHIGTGTYEVGALFAIEGETVDVTSNELDLETANNIDLTFRKTQGNVGFVLNAFYNQVDNYYYQAATGLFAESGDEHNHAEEGDDHGAELPVYLFGMEDVILHGFEAQVAWQVTDEFKATFFSDYVRARLKDGGDLPRTPPMRIGSQLSYQTGQLSAHLDITRYQQQDRIAAYETVTDGYTLVDASVSYDLTLLEQDMSVYLKGSNLTDTEARVHTSFLKDIAPRPGRSIAIGLRGYF